MHSTNRLQASQYSIIPPPESLAFQLTSRCNATCYYCPCHRKILDFPKMVSTESLLQKIAEADEAGVQVVRFSGGEPLLRQDLEILIGAVNAKGMQATIVTNGSLLSERRFEGLVSAGLSAITLSLDSLDPEVYEAIRGLPFRHVERNLRQFHLAQEFGRLWAGITVVISRANTSGICDMVERLSERGIPVQFQPCHSYSASRENDENLPDLAELEPAIAHLIEMKTAGYLVNNSVKYLEGIPTFVKTGRPPSWFTCTVARRVAVYDADLYLRPCCFILPAVTNSQTRSLMEAWTSDVMQVWRTRFENGECPGCWLLSLDTWK